MTLNDIPGIDLGDGIGEALCTSRSFGLKGCRCGANFLTNSSVPNLAKIL